MQAGQRKCLLNDRKHASHVIISTGFHNYVREIGREWHTRHYKHGWRPLCVKKGGDKREVGPVGRQVHRQNSKQNKGNQTKKKHGPGERRKASCTSSPALLPEEAGTCASEARTSKRNRHRPDPWRVRELQFQTLGITVIILT